MIDNIFLRYQDAINSASGATAISFRESISGTLFMAVKINSFSGNPINPSLPIELTNFSLTKYDASGAGRIIGIDNYHHDKILHGHLSSSESIIISGSHTLATIASYAFLEFFR